MPRLSELFKKRHTRKRRPTKRKARRSVEQKASVTHRHKARQSKLLLSSSKVVATASTPQPASVSIQSIGGFYTVRELLRPEGQLKTSIEGFLLDQRSEHTRLSYSKDLKRFFKFLLARENELGLAKVDRSAIVAYKEFLVREGLQHTTVDRHLATLRSFFQWLVDDGLLDKSPAGQVRFLNPKRISSTIGFSDEEVLRVLSAPDVYTRTGCLHAAVLGLLFYCGLRRSELCALKVSQWQEERGMPVLRLLGKGNQERLVVIPEPAEERLKKYFSACRRDRLAEADRPLFEAVKKNQSGRFLDPSMIFYIVRKYARLAGVQSKVSPHSCRATAISNARDHQASDRAIQEFAGWSSPSMITHYDKRKNAVENSASLSIDYED